MSAFEKVPTALATDSTITLAARAVYPVLLAEAFKRGARPGEQVELPPLRDLAITCACSITSLKGYVAELRKAGWVTTTRAARGRPQLYTMHPSPVVPAPARGSESGPRNGSRGSESGSRVGQNLAHSRARDPLPDLRPDVEPTVQLHGDPPPIVLVDGRNLPLDALADECGIDPDSPRLRQAVAALNGARGKDGIKHLFWREACRWVEEHAQDAPDAAERFAALREDPEKFAAALERGIRRKASLYRERLPGATLTPTALLSWWLDVERQPGRSDGAMTPDEMRRYAETT